MVFKINTAAVHSSALIRSEKDAKAFFLKSLAYSSGSLQIHSRSSLDILVESLTDLPSRHGHWEVPGGYGSDDAHRLLQHHDARVSTGGGDDVSVSSLRLLSKPLHKGRTVVYLQTMQRIGHKADCMRKLSVFTQIQVICWRCQEKQWSRQPAVQTFCPSSNVTWTLFA